MIGGAFAEGDGRGVVVEEDRVNGCRDEFNGVDVFAFADVEEGVEALRTRMRRVAGGADGVELLFDGDKASLTTEGRG